MVEADEYKRAFLEYEPDIAVITNVEPDHLDYYGTPEAYHEAFVQFGQRVKEGGVILACADDPGAREVSDALGDDPLRHETYGIEGVRYWMGRNIQLSSDGVDFEVVRGGTPLGACIALVPGDTSCATAIAAAAVCLHLDVPFDDDRWRRLVVQGRPPPLRAGRRSGRRVGDG